MINSQLKIVLRSLWRNRKFAALNIFGLSIGMATCLIIVFYMHHELSYDKFNTKADQIVRVIFKAEVGGQQMNEANVMPPVAKTLLSNFPEIQQATRLVQGGSPILVSGRNRFKEDDFAYVDANFFSVFTLPWLEGDLNTALMQPGTVVITKAVAQKYFGDKDPMGQILKLSDGQSSFKVTGVIDKVPENSHFHFDFFASISSWPDAQSASFMTSGYYTYLVLPKDYAYQKLAAKLPGFVAKYIGPQLKEGMGMSYNDFTKNGNRIGLFLQPLTAIHLSPGLSGELSASGNLIYLYIFGAIAILVLLIACINYMNLATAGASKRAREVGIRKVFGSGKSSLIRRFMLESFFLTMSSFILSLGIIYAALPLLNRLSGLQLSMTDALHSWMIPILALVALFTGLLAGIYPAFFLSSYRPITVLKGDFSTGEKSVKLRKGLVVFQFMVSIILMVCTGVVYKQLHYMSNLPLGYDKNQVLVLPETWLLGKNQEVFRQKLLQDPRIASVSVSGYLPAGATYGNNFTVYPDKSASSLLKTLRYDIDPAYIPTMGMHVIKGRNFSKDFSTDSTAVIINETALKAFGWQKDPLDHTLTYRENNGAEHSYRVIGVVRDFHFRSLHELITPLVMVLGGGAGTMIVKLKGAHTQDVLPDIKKTWDALGAESAMTYSFLDDRVEQTYASENRTGMLLGIFSSITILIACLGLFGLVMYSAEARTKEIGIRKVLGASVGQVMRLLSRDFIKLVLLAFIIAVPAAWLVMHTWLQSFAYSIKMGWLLFLVAGILSVLITFITICFQVVKSAKANPVQSLSSDL
ncbi:MAG TPA: ABC transporter permease [Arachidicoccus sp.]|nr:ABC transporter permease [Arachidicoccus sp.]